MEPQIIEIYIVYLSFVYHLSPNAIKLPQLQ